MVERFDKTGSTGEGNGKLLQHSCLENPMNGTKMQRDTTLKDEPSRLVNVQYDTGEEQRNGSKKNEEMKPKQKRCPAVGVHGGESIV